MINLKYIPIDIIQKGLSYTNTIADSINLEFPNYYINLPTPFPDKNDRDVMNEFIKQGWQKYNIDNKPNKQEYIDRLNTELDNIIETEKLKVLSTLKNFNTKSYGVPSRNWISNAALSGA
jgi:DNA polymerase III alpha subunit